MKTKYEKGDVVYLKFKKTKGCEPRYNDYDSRNFKWEVVQDLGALIEFQDVTTQHAFGQLTIITRAELKSKFTILLEVDSKDVVPGGFGWLGKPSGMSIGTPVPLNS